MPPRTVPTNPALARLTGAQDRSRNQSWSVLRVPRQDQGANAHPLQNKVTVQNRVSVFLVHVPRLSISGQARLAAEAGVSRSTISRLVNGRINPSYRLARSVTDVLERLLGEPLDMRDVFTTDGTYLVASGCERCHCRGCLPESAWDEDGTLKPEWRDARPGDWSLARPASSAASTDDLARASSAIGRKEAE